MRSVQPSGDFAWGQETWGAALRCRALPAPHLFSTRDLALKAPGGNPIDGWAALATSMGVAPQRMLRPRQVHGTAVTVGSSLSGAVCDTEADIIVTNDPATAVAVQMADCVPILIADRRRGAVAGVHAGWRGTAAGAVQAAVAALCDGFHADPNDLVAAIGPSIGVCCYTVGEERVDAFRSAAHPSSDTERWFVRAGGLHLDLWRANRDQLEDAGLRPEQIHVAALCTRCHPDLFHSCRRDGKAAGRLAAAIRPNPNREPQTPNPV